MSKRDNPPQRIRTPCFQRSTQLQKVAARESSYLPRAYAGVTGTSTVVQDYATEELYPFFRRYARPCQIMGKHLSMAA